MQQAQRYCENIINMNKITLLLLLYTIFSFGQETNKNAKIIRGFILDNAEYTRTKVPISEATIEIKGTERKTFSDQDGKFEIQANKGEILVVKVLFKNDIEILVTDKECYKVDLNSVLFEPLMGGRWGRKYKRQQRKIERSMKRKIKEGFYNCPNK